MINPFQKISAWISNHLPKRRSQNGAAPDAVAQAERQLVHSLAKSRLPGLRQLRYLPQLLTKNERFLAAALGGFVVVAAIFLGVRVFARHVTSLPRPGGEVTEALIGTPQYVNPILASTNDVDRDLIRLLYAGLFKRNERQEIVPDLAKSYELSDDKKTYTVHLRDNLAWSDNQPITADDVVSTFELIQSQLYKSPLRSQFRNVKVDRVDDRTVKFTLNQPSASFLANLTVGILPVHIWGDVLPPNFALVEFNIKPVGSGPFEFDSLKRDASTGQIKEYRLIRNARYHGDRPYLDRLTFRIFPDVDAALEALRTKKVESVSFVNHDLRNDLKQVQIVDLQLPRYTAIFLNGKRAVLKAIEIRRALAQALDRQRMVTEVFHGAATIVDGPFASNFPGYAGKLQPDFDVAAANATLEAAGWIRPAGSTVRKKGNDELTVSLTVVEEPDDQALAALVKQSWEAIGVKVEVKTFDAARIAKDVIKPREFDAFLYGEILSNGDPYPFWHSSQNRDPGLNLTTFFNKDADKLLDELRTTTDETAVKEKRIAFQRLLADNLPAIFLYSPLYSYGLSKRVKGFNVNYVSTPADRFDGVEYWYVKTRTSFKR